MYLLNAWRVEEGREGGRGGGKEGRGGEEGRGGRKGRRAVSTKLLSKNLGESRRRVLVCVSVNMY